MTDETLATLETFPPTEQERLLAYLEQLDVEESEELARLERA